jgi:hypothetical protein
MMKWKNRMKISSLNLCQLKTQSERKKEYKRFISNYHLKSENLKFICENHKKGTIQL